MPTYQTTGIVIGRTNFGEADRVVRFLTPGHGKVSAVAKGVRRIKSRAAGHLELFGEVNLMLASGRNLDVVTSARLIWYPHRLAVSYDTLGLAFAMAIVIDRLSEPGQASYKVYEVLREAIHALDQNGRNSLLELWFKLRLLNSLGYRPELSGCMVCGRHDPALEYRFDPALGGISCAADATSTATPISLEAVKLWRLLSDYPYATVSQIPGAPELATATLSLCNEFYEHQLGHSFTK
jgi:DNA repair protein RecO (recombination protein O)